MDNLYEIFINAYNLEYDVKTLEQKLKDKIGHSRKEQLFALFVRDVEFGLGFRNLGKELMYLTKVSSEEVVAAGRFDDLLTIGSDDALSFWYNEIKAGNEVAKRYAPRFPDFSAFFLSSIWLMNREEYCDFIECNKFTNSYRSFLLDNSKPIDERWNYLFEKGFEKNIDKILSEYEKILEYKKSKL